VRRRNFCSYVTFPIDVIRRSLWRVYTSCIGLSLLRITRTLRRESPREAHRFRSLPSSSLHAACPDRSSLMDARSLDNTSSAGKPRANVDDSSGRWPSCRSTNQLKYHTTSIIGSSRPPYPRPCCCCCSKSLRIVFQILSFFCCPWESPVVRMGRRLDGLALLRLAQPSSTFTSTWLNCQV
jgi:hypothetical protein